MRDLRVEELSPVYGAGGYSKKKCPPKKPSRKSRCGKGGSGSGSYGKCRGGSS